MNLSELVVAFQFIDHDFDEFLCFFFIVFLKDLELEK